MLEARPGAFIFIGNGDTAGLHHPAYDFNDEAIPVGVSYWARLVETAMPAAEPASLGFAKRQFLARRLAHQRKPPGARSRSGRED